MLHLNYHPPLAWDTVVKFLCSRSSPRLDQLDNGCYLRTVKLSHYNGWITARQDTTHHRICVEVSPSLLPCLTQLQLRLRALFDLDANPAIIESHLKCDKTLQQLVARSPGLRIPGALDTFELSLRAILGQQVTVKAATTLFSRFIAAFGEPVDTPFPGLDRTGPVASAIADANLQTIIDLGLTQRRALTVHRLAQTIVDGTLKLEPLNRSQSIEQLHALPGIGPWTAQYIAMRALGDPNAFPASDLGLLRALQMKKPAEILHRAETWQPWRAYGAIHLWHHLNLETAVDRLSASGSLAG